VEAVGVDVRPPSGFNPPDPEVSVRLLCLLVLPLLTACTVESTVPTENVVDYRVNVTGARASTSCGADLEAEAAAVEPYSIIYRFFRLSEDTDDDGVGDELSNDIEVYWRDEGTNESDFTWFGQGILEGDLDTGAFNYGARSFREEKDDGIIYYDVEGRAPVRFSDELRNGTEDYVIVTPTNDANFDFSVGCVYTLEFDGTKLTADDPDAS
jgi:hypothetical protein